MLEVRPALVLRTVVALFLLAICVSGCKSQFRTEVEAVASNIGRNADEVENGFRRALPGATETELEVAATRSASETAWMKSLGRSVLAEWEEQQTLRAVSGGTCDVVGLINDTTKATTEAELESVIRYHIRLQGLAPTDKKIADVAKGIAENLKSMIAEGKFDDGVLIDLACLPF
jgi:hypothetical protein